jgi:hypothetical protein
MKDHSVVIGDITVELIKKHGKRETHTENLVTGFGKSAVIANGLATMFGSLADNKIEYNTKNPDPQGVGTNDFFFTRDTSDTKVVNMLLNNPTLAAGQGLYIPGSELVGYAYRDTASDSNEGTTTSIADGTAKKKRLTRRYSYGSSMAFQFDTIATSLITPSGSAGALISIPRFINASDTISNISARGIQSGKLQLKTSSDDILDYDVNTGEISQSADSWISYDPQFLLSVFSIGDYTYEVRGTDTAKAYTIRIYGYDSTGANVYTSDTYSGTYMDSYNLAIIYDAANDAYLLYRDGTWYAIAVDSNGLITGISRTTTSLSNPPSYRMLLGNKENYVYVDGYKLYGTYDTSSYFTSGVHGVINIDGRIYSKDLTETGNLLSYHKFSVPFVKDVGDVLNVSYSYYID